MRTSVRAVIVKDDQLLLMKRSRDGQAFYTLVGGGIDDGETPEQALEREVHEESSIVIANPKLAIIMEHEGFGTQYIYTCDYVSGSLALSTDSEEAAQTADGQNTYEPVWLPADDLRQVEMLPLELRSVLCDYLNGSFPLEPIELKIAS